MTRLILRAGRITVGYEYTRELGDGAMIEPWDSEDRVILCGDPDDLRAIADGLLQIADGIETQSES